MLRDLVPGACFEVEYVDDDVAHERLALWPAGPGRWAVRSPDGDEWIEDVDGSLPETGPARCRPRRGRGANEGRMPLYAYREPLDETSRRAAVVRGLRRVLREGELAATPVVQEVMTAAGARVPLAEYFSRTTSDVMLEAMDRRAPAGAAAEILPIVQVGGGAAGWEPALPRHSPGSDVWLAHSEAVGVPLGAELTLSPGVDIVFGESQAMVKTGGKWVLAERCSAVEAPSVAARLRGEAGPSKPAAGDDRMDRLLAVDGQDGAAAGDRAGAARASDDARTLWVDWDRHGERYKAWRDVCQESTSEPLEEGRLQGASTSLHMCKAMQRQGGDPRSWLEAWLREKRLDNTDRTSHELRVLTDVLYMAGVVDQLNMGGLCALEVVCRRIAAIVEAHAVPGRPSWEHARYYAGAASSEEVVAPALRAQVLRQVKEAADIATMRSRTLHGAAEGGAARTADDTGGGNPKRGGGAAKARGKGGAQDAPPAAV